MSLAVGYIPGFHPNMSLTVAGQELPAPVLSFSVPHGTVMSNLRAFAVPVTTSGVLSSSATLVAALTNQSSPSARTAAMSALVAGATSSGAGNLDIVLSIDTALRSSDPAVAANGGPSVATVCRLWIQSTVSACGYLNFFIYLTDSGGDGDSSVHGSNLGTPVLLCNTGPLTSTHSTPAHPVEAVWNLSQGFVVAAAPSNTAGALLTHPATPVSGTLTWYLAPVYPTFDPTVTLKGNVMTPVAAFTVQGGVPCDYGSSGGPTSSLPTDSSYPTEDAPYQVTAWISGTTTGSSMNVNDLHVVQTPSTTAGAPTTTVTLYVLTSTPCDRAGANSLAVFVSLRDMADHTLTVPFRIIPLENPVLALTATPIGGLISGVYYLGFQNGGPTPLLYLSFPSGDALTGSFGSSVESGFSLAEVEATVSLASGHTLPSLVVLGQNLNLSSGNVYVQYNGMASNNPPNLPIPLDALAVTEFGRTFTFSSSTPTYTFSLGITLSNPWTNTSVIPNNNVPAFQQPLSGGSGGASYCVTASSVAPYDNFIGVSTGNMAAMRLPYAFIPQFYGVGTVTLTITAQAYYPTTPYASTGQWMCKYVPDVATGYPQVPYFSKLINQAGTTVNMMTHSSTVQVATGITGIQWTSTTTLTNSTSTQYFTGLAWPSSSYATTLNGYVTTGGTTAFMPILLTFTLNDITGATYSTTSIMRVYADFVSIAPSYLLGSTAPILNVPMDLSAYNSGGTYTVTSGITLVPYTILYAGGVWQKANDINGTGGDMNPFQFATAGIVTANSLGYTSSATIVTNGYWTDITASQTGSAYLITFNFYGLPDPTHTNVNEAGAFIVKNGSTAVFTVPNAIVLEPLVTASAVGKTSTLGAVVNLQDKTLCLFPSMVSAGVALYEIPVNILEPPVFIPGSTWTMVPTLRSSTISTSSGTVDSSTTADYLLLQGCSSQARTSTNALVALELPATTGGLSIGTLNPSAYHFLVMTFTWTAPVNWMVPYTVNGVYNSAYNNLATTPNPTKPLVPVTATAVLEIPLVLNTVQVLMNVEASSTGGVSSFADSSFSSGVQTITNSAMPGYTGYEAPGTWLYNPGGLFTIPSTVPTYATITMNLVSPVGGGHSTAYPAIVPWTPVLTASSRESSTESGVTVGFYTGIAGTGGGTALVSSQLVLTYSSGSGWTYGASAPLSNITAVAFAPSATPNYGSKYTNNYYMLVLATVTVGTTNRLSTNTTCRLTVNPVIDASPYYISSAYTTVFPPSAMTGLNQLGFFGYELLLELELTSWSHFGIGGQEEVAGSSEGSFASATSGGEDSLLFNFRRYWTTGGTGLPSLDFQIPDCVCLNLGDDANGYLSGAAAHIRFQLECSGDSGTWYVLATNLGGEDSATDLMGVNAAILGPWPERLVTLNADGSIPLWGSDDSSLGGSSAPLVFRLGVQTDYAWNQGEWLVYGNPLPVTNWRFSGDLSAVSKQYNDYHHPNTVPVSATRRLAQTDTGRYFLAFNSTIVTLPTLDGSSSRDFYVFQQDDPPDVLATFSSASSSTWF